MKTITAMKQEAMTLSNQTIGLYEKGLISRGEYEKRQRRCAAWKWAMQAHMEGGRLAFRNEAFRRLREAQA